MKKRILITTALLCSCLGSFAYADEVNLKKSCVKDNPLVAGESDAALLKMYSEVCDKKNKDNKTAYLAQAAQRFQQLGKNYKALQLVNELQASNVQHSSLTDVKFLAGIAIANEALTQIRGAEVRYLTDETYLPAYAFSEAIKKAKPLSVIEPKVEEAPKRTEARTTRQAVTQKAQPRRNTTTTRPKNQTRSTSPARTTNTAPKAVVQPKRESPFGSL